MHDLRDTSLTRSENGRSSDCLSFQGSNANGIGASVPDEDTTSFHYPDRSTSNREKMKSHRPWAKDRDAQHPHSSKNRSIASGASLSDTHMASRRAEQAANRRMLAAMWLQEIVGVTSLPNEPSEEELRLCLRNGLVLCNAINKVQPGAVPKVVEIPPLSNHLDGAQSAYQYFENVRNFLVAVEEMGLPSFEASDLEQVSLCPSSSAKLVDCILALKAYHEWKQGGAMGFWRLKSPNHLMGCVPNSGKYVTRHKSMNSMCNQARRKWGHPDLEYLGDRDILSSPDLSANPLIFDRDSRASLEGMLYNSHFDQNGRGNGDADEALSDMHMSDSTSAWLQYFGHKFREVLQVKMRQMQDMPTSTDAGISVSVDNAYFHSLSSFISAILGDKPAEEVPMLVEFLLRKVIEEFEYHLLAQRKQVTKMGKKLMEEEKRVNEEEADRVLKESHEPDYMKRPDEQELLALEKQKRELEVESKHRICTLELQLQDAQRKMHEIEMDSASLETKYQMFLFHQAEEYKNLRSAQHGAKEEVVRMQMEWKCQLSSLEKELQAMARAASGYHKVLAENRALYNEVQDLKGNIRVYCRVRPFLSDEPGRPTTVDYIGENGEIVLVNPSQQGGKDSRKAFAFNKVFGTMASQEEVFMDTQPLIRSVLDGYNVCIFAYGQTGSGKTFTMNGPNNMTPFNWGVNYRALHDLFHLTQSRLDVFHYEIGVQMLEIYNEQVRDLLNTDGVPRKLEIRNSSQLNGSNVPDASMMTVRSTEDVLELMKVGQKNRAVGATALNDRSSRSHSILTIHIQGTDLDSGTTLRGSLHLVDLAGSERVDKSEATGDRLKEAQHINKSLSALGDVIAALAQKSGHVPYRNSKLTQLLQDSLGGQAKTLMFVHVSPDIESFGETVSTLKFAERVSSVELGAARSNKESGEVLNLRAQVAQLRDAASKKDAEIERLQALKDRGTPGESNLGNDKFKFKPFSASPHGRRMSTEPAVQRNHKLTMDTGGVVSEVRRSMNKLSGLPKWSRFLVPNARHDSEDAMEHSVSPSVCSPVQSRTERKLSFEGSEELANVMNDKKLLKMRKSTHHLRQSISSLETHKVVLALKETSQQQEELHSNHREITMHDTKCLSEHTAPQMAHVESIAKDWHDRCQTGGNKSVLTSEGHSGSRKIQHDAANSGGLHERTNRLKPPSNGVFSSQQVSNGDLDHLTEEPTTDGQTNCGVFSNTSLYMSNGDVLDEHLENNGMLELRDNYQDDGGILLSESHPSVEIDLSLKVDQNKRLYSSSGQPRHERKALFETQIPCPPVKKSLKISPIRSLRRSIGGPLQAHPRRYTDVASVASTDKKLIAKGNISGRGNSAPEDELHVLQENVL